MTLEQAMDLMREPEFIEKLQADIAAGKFKNDCYGRPKGSGLPRVWTPEKRTEAKRLAEKGLSLAQIGQKIGVSRSSVGVYLHQCDIPSKKYKRRKPRSLKAPIVINLFKKGHTVKEIGEIVGMNSRTVYNYIWRDRKETV